MRKIQFEKRKVVLVKVSDDFLMLEQRRGILGRLGEIRDHGSSRVLARSVLERATRLKAKAGRVRVLAVAREQIEVELSDKVVRSFITDLEHADV